ncbi:MAG: alkaline phosphatase [Armatimonadetes bacterium]|nr:alkaline phosphatase [Armatimonadota bacterium]
MLQRLSQHRFGLALLVVFLVASASLAEDAPKSIILLIGDGMGVGHITAARCAGPGRDGRLAMDNMPVTGLAITHSANALVTDSAAAGTALATGVKTTNGTISQTPDGKPLRSILEVARDMGKSTGIVSTAFITDATPAVFVAHVSRRSQREDIATQMIASGVDVILGGGREYFVPKSAGGGRSDDRNLLDEARKLGFEVFETAEAMNSSISDRIIGLFAHGSMTSRRPEPTIAEMTSKAISVLARNPKGFFLMSEGAKIDSEAHSNNADGVVREILMFDEAVKVALDFAKKDGSTLVLVTADHSTGGMSVQEPSKENPKFTAGWTSGGHSGDMVPIYAFGPGSELFTGTHDNTEIPRLMAKLWGKTLN